MPGLVYFGLLAVTDLAGVFFNTRMLLGCFKNKTKPYTPVFETLKPLIICQFVYQVVILATNTVEAWREYDESCCALRLLSSSANIFLAFNVLAMWVNESSKAVVYKTRQLSPMLLMATALCLGFVNSALVWWHSRVYHKLSVFHDQVGIIFILNFVVVCLLYLAFVARNNFTKPEQTTAAATGEASLSKNCWRKSKEVISFIVLFSMSFVPVIMLHVSYSNLAELDQSQWLKAVSRLSNIIQNLAVGIILPVYLRRLTEDTSSKEELGQITTGI